MQLKNTFTVPVPADQVWEALLDAERVAPCMPGASVDSVEGQDVNGSVKVKLGPISMTYRGVVRYVETDQPGGTAVLSARAKDTRGNGSADARVAVAVRSKQDETTVDVRTDLQVTGRPAQFGRGVIEDVSGHIFDQFATNLSALLTRGPDREAAQPGSPAGAPRRPVESAPAAGELDAWTLLLPVLRQRAAQIGVAVAIVAGLGLIGRRLRR